MAGGPRLSVLLAVHNGARHLRAALDSVLGQSLDDLELIVVDDGSTDATGEILASYRDNRMSVVTQELRGQTRSLNRGIEIARAPYIARQDADDVSLAERLKRQVAFLDRHPEVALVGSAVGVIDDTGRRLGGYVYPTGHEALVERLTNFENPLPHTTLVIRTGVLRELGGYDERFPKSQDFDLLFRLTDRHRVASLSAPLCLLRLSVDSASFADGGGEQLRWALVAYARARLQRRHGVDLLASPEWPAILADFERWFAGSGYRRLFRASRGRRVARLALADGRLAEGVRALGGALRDDPVWVLRKAGLVSSAQVTGAAMRWLEDRWRRAQACAG